MFLLFDVMSYGIAGSSWSHFEETNFYDKTMFTNRMAPHGLNG